VRKLRNDAEIEQMYWVTVDGARRLCTLDEIEDLMHAGKDVDVEW